MDRNVLLAVAAAKEAWDDAGLDGVDPARVGILVGSAIGGIATIVEQQQVFAERGPDRVSPFFIPSVLVDTASGQIAIQLGLKGQNFAPVSACATGSTAIGEAAASIRRGQADVVLAGGTEAPITPLILAGFCAMRGLVAEEEDPTLASRPFDATRAGFVMGEGACILVLEELEAARARGATIYAEVLGYGASNDAHHLAQPEPEAIGVAAMIGAALDAAGVAPERVGYVNAHGTSTPLGDLAETRALKQVFGDHAYRLAVSSTKSVTGHCFGSAGAVEAMMCALALRQRRPSADDQLPEPGPGVRPRLRPERGAPGRGRRRALERDGPRRPQRLRPAGPGRLTSPRRVGGLDSLRITDTMQEVGMGPQTASLGHGAAVPGATACRHCGAPLELTVVDLGKSPLCQTVADDGAARAGGGVLPAPRARVRAMLARPDRRSSCRPRTSSPSTRTSPPTPIRGSSTRAATSTTMIERLGSRRATASSSSSRRTTATCSSTSPARASRCSASSRR